MLRLPLIVLLLLVPASPSLQATEIRSVATEYLDRDAFFRISEHLTGTENMGRRLVGRSQPDRRDGLYFILRVRPGLRHLPAGASGEIAMITAASPDPEVVQIPLPDERPRGREIYLGITGIDWAGPLEPLPTAWKVTLRDASGEALAEYTSYLWGPR